MGGLTTDRNSTWTGALPPIWKGRVALPFVTYCEVVLVHYWSALLPWVVILH